MQIHAVWFVRKDGTAKAREKPKVAWKRMPQVGSLWLEEEITNRTGLFADSGYMDKILKGKRNAPKVVQAIRDILEIQDCNQDTSAEAQ